MALDEKFGRLQQLVEAGKEKGYVLYDEVSELLPTDLNGGADLDDVLAGLDSAGIEILEEPKLEFDKKPEDGEEFLDLELLPGVGEKINDPVRMYLREMGTVPLLTREGEVEIARRIERGQNTVLQALSRSPLVVQEVLRINDELPAGTVSARDILSIPDPALTDEIVADYQQQFSNTCEEISKYFKGHYKSAKIHGNSARNEAETVPAPALGSGPRHGEGLAPGAIVRFQGPVLRQFIDRIRCAVDELKPLEREIAESSARWRRFRRCAAATGNSSKNSGGSSAVTAPVSSSGKKNTGRPPPNFAARCR